MVSLAVYFHHVAVTLMLVQRSSRHTSTSSTTCQPPQDSQHASRDTQAHCNPVAVSTYLRTSSWMASQPPDDAPHSQKYAKTPMRESCSSFPAMIQTNQSTGERCTRRQDRPSWFMPVCRYEGSVHCDAPRFRVCQSTCGVANRSACTPEAEPTRTA